MKRVLTTIFSFAIFLSLTPLSHAEFTVVPSPPHDRQFNFEIPPGQTQTSSIIVKNLGGQTLNVSTYSADGTNSSQGTFALTSRSHDQNHIGTWASFNAPTITIPPRSDVTIPFTLTVPADVTPGNYGGGIAVEASSAALNGEDGLNESGAVTTAARIYVRTFVNVPGDKVNDYEWSNFGFNEKTEVKKPYFHFSFKNNGNTIIMAKPSVHLSGFPPLAEATLKLPEITIQPGTSLENLEMRWDNQPSVGYYFVTANVEFSEFDIVANKEIKGTTLEQKIGINLTPWYITAILIIVIIIVTGLIVYTIISRKRLLARCKQYKVKQGDSITSIAKEYNINWKTLARINKIKRPYTLKIGQNILVPSK